MATSKAMGSSHSSGAYGPSQGLWLWSLSWWCIQPLQCPATQGLRQAMPTNNKSTEAEQTLIAIDGSPPDLFNPPRGCAYHPRCPYSMQVCAKQVPSASKLGPSHQTQCWLHHDMAGPLPDGLVSVDEAAR